jgi:hypothetical protein
MAKSEWDVMADLVFDRLTIPEMVEFTKLVLKLEASGLEVRVAEKTDA